MAKEKFDNRRLKGKINVACKYEDGSVRYWSTSKEEVVARIIAIVSSFRKQGYKLTLRQLHYQFVSRNWIVNHDTAYKKLGDILTDCRYAGMVDWDDIEDRGRVPYIPYHASDANEAIEDAIDYFRIDRQEGQSTVVELWTEKDALSGILKRTTQKYHVHLVVNKGYSSATAMYNSYRRAAESIISGNKFCILYFGDHDPSGLDMVRDIEERIRMMLCNGDLLKWNEEFMQKVLKWWRENYYDIYTLVRLEFCDEKVLKLLNEDDDDDLADHFESGRLRMYFEEHKIFEIVAIGLTMDQIKKYNLPPNPTKLTDTRASNYIQKYGKTCWEVDALNPDTLTEIVEENIQSKIDMDVFSNAISRELEEKDKLKSFIKR